MRWAALAMAKGARVIRGLRFPAPPPAETSFMLADGQVYTLAKAEPYTRADGRQSCLLHWDTTCPITGKAFTVLTGLSFNPAVVRRRHPDAASQTSQTSHCDGGEAEVTPHEAVS
jgi:hypothetical protein